MTTAEPESRATGIFQMTNINCSGCSVIIKKSLRKVEGVISVNINYITDKVYVDYDPKAVSPEKIRKTIEKAGYRAFQVARNQY